jgi:hypothetical protein
VSLPRLRPIGIGEIACRGRQEAWKRLERIGVGPGAASPRIPGPERMLERAAARFFAGAADGTTSALVAGRWPQERERAREEAEAIERGRFDLLGYRGLSFGDPIDWHLDPVSRRRAPLVHWSRIDPLDAAAVGDSKVVWELNRHQWLVRLGVAYRLTGEPRYAATAAARLRGWMGANPPGIGINWASSLEAALRLISWCWALVLFRGSPALAPDLLERVLGGIETHARHVERYLSRYFSPNTHLTGEALGLFYAGTLFPDLRPARRWRALGRRILVEQGARQVLPDGVYFEQSTCYQRYTAEIHLHFLILAARSGVALPGEVTERTRRLLDFLLALRRPDGSTPQIGDADGGWLLPLVPRAPDDLRGLFSTAAAFFGRPDYAWAAGECAPETPWLLGAAGLAAFDALRPSPPDRETARVFADGGYVVMRSGWDREAHQLIFDAGPLGCPLSGGHGHADLLAVQCSVFGEPGLLDPGTYCYAAEPGWRDFFRGASAHSTVLVDGMEQAIPAGPFAWERRPRARLSRFVTTGAFDCAEGEHHVYRRLADPVTHRRRVIFVKPRYFVLVDELDGEREHRIEIRFQFAPLRVRLEPDLWARASGRGGRGFLIRAFAPAALGAVLRAGDLDPIQGWFSPDYGRRRPAPVLVYSATARLPLRVATLLLPAADPSAPPPVVSPLSGDGPGPAGLVFGDTLETVRFDGPDGVTLLPPCAASPASSR